MIHIRLLSSNSMHTSLPNLGWYARPLATRLLWQVTLVSGAQTGHAPVAT